MFKKGAWADGQVGRDIFLCQIQAGSIFPANMTEIERNIGQITDKYIKTMMARGLRNVETTTCRAPTRMVEPNRCGEGII
jgi:hypothetical protein